MNTGAIFTSIIIINSISFIVNLYSFFNICEYNKLEYRIALLEKRESEMINKIKSLENLISENEEFEKIE